MARKPYDPLVCIPSPSVVRTKLHETEMLAKRLRILLDLSERVHEPLNAPVVLVSETTPPTREGVAHV